MGDEVFAVMVHLESWERINEGGGGEPPLPPNPPQHGPAEGPIEDDDADSSIHLDGDDPQGSTGGETDAAAGEGEVEEGLAPREVRAIPPAAGRFRMMRGKGETGRAGTAASRGWRRKVELCGGGGREMTGKEVCGGRRWIARVAGGAPITRAAGGATIDGRSHATVTGGESLEGGGAPDPRLGEKMQGGSGYTSWDGGSQASGSSVLALFLDKGTYGSNPKVVGPKDLVDRMLSLGVQAWEQGFDQGLWLKSVVLMMSVSVGQRGCGIGYSGTGLRAWHWAPGPSLEPTCHLLEKGWSGVRIQLAEGGACTWVGPNWGGSCSSGQMACLEGDEGAGPRDRSLLDVVDDGVGARNVDRSGLWCFPEAGDRVVEHCDLNADESRAISIVPYCARSSRRLANGGKTSMLQRAMARKAFQREGGDGAEGRRDVNSLVRKSRLCGVNLGEAEAWSFGEFVNWNV